MIRHGDLYNAHQQARFMRPDAARYIHPDTSRWQKPPHPDEQKYSPSQPRDWRGRWTVSIGVLARPFGSLDIQPAQEGAEGEANSGGILAFAEESQASTMFDIDPDVVGNAGDELAQNRYGRSGNSVTINGQQFELTPAQGARLYNRLYRQMEKVEAQLKAREGDQRRALLPLYRHPSPTVRFKAAIATFVFAPREAREVLQLIKDRKEFPIAMNASQMLSAIDEGRYTPG
ncbi:MAG: hypothetical protein OJF48_002500 [Afipia sp.]|jgi:hypothetical protein|nr:MAG: hypothetical protein OJF48_002500 [Afipia sp.]